MARPFTENERILDVEDAWENRVSEIGEHKYFDSFQVITYHNFMIEGNKYLQKHFRVTYVTLKQSLSSLNHANLKYYLET